MFVYMFIGSVRTMSDWEEDEETVNPLPLSAYFPGTFGCNYNNCTCCALMVRAIRVRESGLALINLKSLNFIIQAAERPYVTINRLIVSLLR